MSREGERKPQRIVVHCARPPQKLVEHVPPFVIDADASVQRGRPVLRLMRDACVSELQAFLAAHGTAQVDVQLAGFLLENDLGTHAIVDRRVSRKKH